MSVLQEQSWYEHPDGAAGHGDAHAGEGVVRAAGAAERCAIILAEITTTTTITAGMLSNTKKERTTVRKDAGRSLTNSSLLSEAGTIEGVKREES